jgi:hypothetical protein
MKAYKIYNSIDNVINWIKQYMTKWGNYCLNKETHDMICIVIIFKWDNIFQECALSHKHDIVFVFGICTKFAQTNFIFFHIMGYANLNPDILQISKFSHDVSK